MPKLNISYFIIFEVKKMFEYEHENLEDIIDFAMISRLDRMIEDLDYLKKMCAVPENKKVLFKKFKKKMEILEFMGVEF